MANPSYDACIVEAELRARAAYAQLHRHYHDQRHIDECLAELDWVVNLTEKKRRILRWSILWHDAIYQPGHRDNERRSAKLAHTELTRCGVDEADVEEVVRLIRLTEKHRVASGDRLGALMVSIDLAILGADPARYKAYAADVRLEYSHVPEKLWRMGRSLVLERMLDKDVLFPDREFRDRLEAQARANMTAEIASLAEG
jgi:predicted metal-dependent HD superfamily phosphohydrolase